MFFLCPGSLCVALFLIDYLMFYFRARKLNSFYIDKFDWEDNEGIAKYNQYIQDNQGDMQEHIQEFA